MQQHLKLSLSHAADLPRKIKQFLDKCLEHSEETQGLSFTVLFCEQHRSLDSGLWLSSMVHFIPPDM